MFIALALTVSGPAYAQTFVGKTVVARFTMNITLCKPQTGCERIVSAPANQNSYIGTRGELFDYASNRTGERRRLGEDFVSDNVRHRWDVEGPNFVWTTTNEVGDTIRIRYRLAGGGRCTVDGDVTKGPRRVGELRVSFDRVACRVYEGVRER